ncbi:shikimate dehydrogenase [Catellatospora tritici]|uniref:shikimate dehydrogenase n=1 Tax=Catellatospora tritici TaxID=2851566 RepID=UPI001C2D0055|nr:shikimate dehydrogenase [Catellatospora tritici]MBV1850384.1 shikimate dehydrogenase [Catellatospora tritici]
MQPVIQRRAAVLGKPVGHSLSPVLHNAGYAAAGLTGWSYTAIECAEAELPDLVSGLGPEWAGLSLTMPLKEVGLTVATEVRPVAAALGVTNTLVRLPDGGWRADNTDVPGMVASLREAGVDAVADVAVLGAGGTARAAVAAAAELGADRVVVYARRPEAIDELRPVAERLGIALAGAGWDRAADCAAADVVISTVPKGVADSLDVPWRAGTVLFDALYHPWPTPLAASAQRAGCGIVSGLDLLWAQALGQFEQFTGVPAPAGPMREALLAAWRARA